MGAYGSLRVVVVSNKANLNRPEPKEVGGQVRHDRVVAMSDSEMNCSKC